uniref:Uncharacterized protein n=1 Tax=Plectus sambesii TaxID=2011161 RepID=A0A914XFC5_9BILA
MLARNSTFVAKRGAAAYAVKPKGSSSSDIKISRLPNGLTVASVDHGSAVSRLAVVFRAGSRYETADEQGVTHHMRNAVGYDTKNFTGVQLLWQTGSAGANLTATGTRDLFTVEVDVIRDQAPRALSLLGEMAAQPAFKHWELADNTETLWVDRAYMREQPAEFVVDLLHKAAFRDGPLGNSLFAHDFNIGHVSHETLKKFAASRLVSGEAAIVGVNIDHGELMAYAAEQAPIVSGQGLPPPTSKYIGGEVRQAARGSLAHVAVAGQGVGLSDAKALATQAVLAAALGTGPAVKYSNGVGSGLAAQAAQKASNNYPFGISALSAAHADTGLVGVYIVAHGEKVGALVKAAVSAFRGIAKSGINEEQINRAKRIAATNVLLNAECSKSLLEDLAAQTLATGSAQSPTDFVKIIESVSATDVQQAANKAVSKLSLAGYGKLDATPYLDEL